MKQATVILVAIAITVALAPTAIGDIGGGRKSRFLAATDANGKKKCSSILRPVTAPGAGAALLRRPVRRHGQRPLQLRRVRQAVQVHAGVLRRQVRQLGRRQEALRELLQPVQQDLLIWAV
ncbi:unnamed protein product [Musa acuminata var. zebrina]